ncbi:sugar ABC transporter ATP-binding protein [Rhodoligotrophos defluvii]|uniref:sugar ABC transporter ATP-binding protein n=1 Tax=Rhodoligotrophos defluvii TaxID=2561934 RepID=UPI0010C95C2D|nr:sugar ABC transporter ATP-binding protein [Rhodoligotrophos defluvii]
MRESIVIAPDSHLCNRFYIEERPAAAPQNRSPDAASPPALELRSATKSFRGVRALSDVSIEIRPGEIHVLLGQNGAGKSTLIKVLAGAHRVESGEILVGGRQVSMASPSDAIAYGIAVIYQEFSLVPSLDIGRNIFLGREKLFSRGGFLNLNALYQAAAKALKRLNLNYDPRRKVSQLTVAQQQMVEIAKALAKQAHVLILDEPTAAISEREAEILFEALERLRTQGCAIVYISHRMREVQRLADRITVLRDGKGVGSWRRHEKSIDELVTLMIGRSLEAAPPRITHRPDQTLLEASGLQTSAVRVDALTVRSGEVVALAGLVGSGRTEVLRAIFGVDRLEAGEIRVAGRKISPSPVAAIANGIGFVPEDRKRQGLALSLPLADNLIASSHRLMSTFGYLPPMAVADRAREMIRLLGIKASGPSQAATTLSGGNQQKVVFGKWLAAGSRLLLLDEPTRGIDIGAKYEVYGLIRDVVEKGGAVLLVTSDLPELIQLAHRAYVMREGTVVGHLEGNALTEKAILDLVMSDDRR